ncbi:phosphatase PAP2 family protein [Skermania piniformis]|uniref:Phosphatase PAP2 family protein n=1 Tax=Skermania pinensis TaxID=39122 RepID=A0ABX8SCJ6_9ACTN|nr:phosphatase PAP2 family protein [Skermania piniformis]QXQ15625.1 phosphatase PAP2 family protein [Skermania piniformis]
MRPPLVVGAVAVVVLLVGLQLAAGYFGFRGPVFSLLSDYLATPASASVPWAGLVLALVGLRGRQRIAALTAAVGLDAVFALERLARGGAATVGNGPLIVLTGLIGYAALRWSGAQQRNALRAAALGALLILATKIGDAYLQLTVVLRGEVLDRYVLLADRALGDPAWSVGRFVQFTGPVGHAILHWVYIELPVAAIVVAIWQLRGASAGRWPSHHLVRTFLVLGMVGPLIYLIFPVVGPVFAFGAQGQGFALGDYWPQTLPPTDLAPTLVPFDTATPRNCMPSMHTAWALALFLHSRRGPGWLRWGGTFWLAATLTATLGFGYHYGVDLVAGAVLCLTVESALREPERGWGWFRIRLVAGGVLALAALLLAYRYLAVQMAVHPGLAGTVVLAVLAAVGYGFYATWFGYSGSSRAGSSRAESSDISSTASSPSGSPCSR